MTKPSPASATAFRHGLQVPVHHPGGIHSMWFNMFNLAHSYAQGEGMKHYVEKVQQPEFAAAKDGYTFVSHQQEVGTGYFDKVTTIIQGGTSSVTALTGSTEESQFGAPLTLSWSREGTPHPALGRTIPDGPGASNLRHGAGVAVRQFTPQRGTSLAGGEGVYVVWSGIADCSNHPARL
ncbi:hypothetical protein ACNKHO_25795 [Shigella flexneri]